MKKFLIALTALFVMLVISGCQKTFDLNTSIGSFEMQSELAESFDDYVPSSGNQLLLIYLSPLDAGMSIDTMADYFRPTEDRPGPAVSLEGVSYDIAYLAYSNERPPTCVFVFEIPTSVKNIDTIALELP